MLKILVKPAKYFYRRTPWATLRTFYFRIFCLLVRNRKVRANLDGINYDLDLGESIDLSLFLGQFEPDVVIAIQRHTKKGMTVFDIGANIGAHNLRFAKLVGEYGHVYGFEPMDYAYNKLVNNLHLNKFDNVIPVHVALSDTNCKAQTINFRSSWRTDRSRSDGVCVVDFIRLDDWCTQNELESVDLIKIDVDGNEFPVLSGCSEIIQRSRPVIIMEAVWPHFEFDERNPFLFLESIGYRFFDIVSSVPYQDQASIRKLLPDGDRGMTYSLNLIALPQGDIDD